MVISKVFAKLEELFSRPWVNPFLTAYVNFRLCKLKDAIKMPIWIYGGAYLDCLNGTCEFPNGSHAGQVKMGMMGARFSAPKGRTFLMLKDGSCIRFYGTCLILLDVNIRLTNNALLEIGDNVLINDEARLYAEKRISIGEGTRFAFGVQVLDTNFHYMIDIEKNTISRKNKPVVIGKYNWLGNKCSIMKGTRTADYTIVSSGSMLNKNYGDEPNSIIAGTPGKIIKGNMQRVFSFEDEFKLNAIFDNTDDNFIPVPSFLSEKK